MDLLGASLLLFLVMDPLGNLPVYLTILKDIEPHRRTIIVVRELLFALAALLLFLVFGGYLFDALSLKRESVSIAGGIILLVIALRMIFPGRGGVMGENPDGEPFLVPLAIPLVAGPSTFSTLLLMSNSDPSKLGQWALATFIAWACSAAILGFPNLFARMLGRRGLLALERLMGMLLVMIAVQMLLNGLESYLRN